MIIEDINGEVITNPDLSKGHLEKCHRKEQTVYVYFPFDEDEQEAYDFQTRADSDRDAAICELYEMITGE